MNLGMHGDVFDHDRDTSPWLPGKGERIELLGSRFGIRMIGTVFYADRLQVLVKWDNGKSQNLRPGVDRFRPAE